MSEEEHHEIAGVSRRQFVQLAAAVSAAGGALSGTAAADGDEGGGDAAELVEEMTLEEKVSRTHGAEGGPEGIAGYLQGVERLDVPGMGMADGPPGASLGDPTTRFPHPIAAAATFDPDLSAEMGSAIAREVKSGGVEVLLAPSMDTFRVPLHARSGETYGEDPALASEMAAAYTGAVQDEGVVATLKHFVCYNQASTTGDVMDYFSFSEHDVRVDERALREIYFRPFRAAVTEGDAGAVMPAYNKINGTFCSENEMLLRDVLKGEWEFDGFVVSDWGGTHSTVKAAENGLDVEMPSAEYFGDALKEAVENGQLDESVVDEMARRTLDSQAEIGALSGEREGSEPVRGTDEHFELAQRIAEEGSVLLQNDSDCLPLDADGIDELAVVGPTPEEFKPSVGGSDHIEAIRSVGPVEGIESVADDVTVTPVATDRYELAGPDGFASRSGDAGFTAEYFASEDWSGDPVETRVEDQIDLTESDLDGVGSDDGPVTVRWSGTLTAPSSGTLAVQLTSQGHGTVAIDGEEVIRSEGGGFAGPKTEEAAVELEEGHEYDVRVEAEGTAPVRFEWTTPGAIADAVEAAESADAAVVLAKTDTFYGDDRHEYELPGNQNAVIEGVAGANDRTVVLLNTEAPVATPWADDVPSILQVWFPGQEGGTAVANLLFGEANPSGKTPVTFAENLDDYLPGEVATLPDGARAYPGVDGTVYYDEGVFVGYRHFDEHGVEPRFPFGHGESYTDFEYSNLRVTPKVKNRNKETVKAKVRVTNVGDCDGAEVVQLYVGDRDASVERPPKELKAFEKVRLSPGEETTVTFELDEEAFAFYHPDGGWTVEAGAFDVLVGSSSRDIRLDEEIEVQATSKGKAKGRDADGGEAATADD
ncbi:beta-glucosidase [Halopelagius longus]|uniref:Beta-glucosidase n=1 Tax=Halopelagius longus TaxID=1236180 RepID=A0A1H1DZZ7_9EURY|nr:glycoside hydrolase family 3 C-terminal domain-containing protein [Halopelagius longus]RDI71538.1 glycosyl hydrolase [Halopelagius longus]SDQ81818.1 beta-glucosidase [Halopelagius longus]